MIEGLCASSVEAYGNPPPNGTWVYLLNLGNQLQASPSRIVRRPAKVSSLAKPLDQTVVGAGIVALSQAPVAFDSAKLLLAGEDRLGPGMREGRSLP